MVGCVHFYEIFFHTVRRNWAFYALRAVRLARSEHARCPRRRRVSVTVVRGDAEFRHPLSAEAGSVRHPLSGLTHKIFLNQSPYKSYRTIKCPNFVRVDAECWQPVVRGESEFQRPLRCLGQRWVTLNFEITPHIMREKNFTKLDITDH